MNSKKTPDMWLFGLAIAFLAIGIFMVFDTSYARAGQVNGDSFHYMKKQALFALIGVVFMFLAMRIQYWKLKSVGFILMLLSIIGLALIFVPGLGVEANGAKRWIHIAGITIQPSEFAKLGLVIYLAALLAEKQHEIRDIQNGLVPALLPLLPIGALIMAQPDMGTTIALAATALVMIYIAGAKSKHMIAVLALGFVMGCGLIFSSPYRTARVMNFINPFEDYHGGGYQVCQSLIALGSGGLFGVGLCEGREKLFYLPAEHTDFILATLGEELGFIGTAVMSLMFLMFAVRGFRIASNTKDGFGRLMAAGISALITGQALLNMLVVTSSVPATGVPLPFISYGGSSLALNLLSVGVLLNISMYPTLPRGVK